MTVVKRYLTRDKDSRDLRDVHSNPEFYDKGIDLVLNLPNAKKRTIDLKVDSYIGSDPSRKIRGLCNPDSGFILLETISQLQYDRSREISTNGTLPARQKADVPGWFFTSSARSEEHTSELQSPCNLVCRLLLEKKKQRSSNTKLVNLHQADASSLEIVAGLLVVVM